LARRFSTGSVRAKIEVFDWLTGKKDRRVKLNPAGYLVDSIRKDYTPPPGFEPEADRDRRRAAESQAERTALAALSQKADEKANAAAELDAIEAYWRSLTTEQQEDLEAAALAEADPEAWERCRSNSSLARMFRRNLRHEQIRKHLTISGR
jgi:hypothetical protein